jgi:hypothetical protein
VAVHVKIAVFLEGQNGWVGRVRIIRIKCVRCIIGDQQTTSRDLNIGGVERQTPETKYGYNKEQNPVHVIMEHFRPPKILKTLLFYIIHKPQDFLGFFSEFFEKNRKKSKKLKKTGKDC